MAQRSSRKRRKQRQRAARPPAGRGRAGAASAPSGSADFMARGYARGRARDEAARAALEPLAPGERPGGGDRGASWSPCVAAVANVVALAVELRLRQGPARPRSRSWPAVLLVAMAVGMWRARYWAVLGMQTLLGLTVAAGLARR